MSLKDIADRIIKLEKDHHTQYELARSCQRTISHYKEQMAQLEGKLLFEHQAWDNAIRVLMAKVRKGTSGLPNPDPYMED